MSASRLWATDKNQAAAKFIGLVTTLSQFAILFLLSRGPQASTLDSKPKILNPQSRKTTQTLNPKPYTLNPSPKPSTFNSKP